MKFKLDLAPDAGDQRLLLASQIGQLAAAASAAVAITTTGATTNGVWHADRREQAGNSTSRTKLCAFV